VLVQLERRVGEYNHKLRRIDPNGTVTTVVGNGVAGVSTSNGVGVEMRANMISSLLVRNANDYVLYSDDSNHRMQRYNPTNGMVTTVAGNGTCGHGCENCAATLSMLCSPSGSTWDPVTVSSSCAVAPLHRCPPAHPPDHLWLQGDWWIADDGNHRVRRVVPAGTITSESPCCQCT